MTRSIRICSRGLVTVALAFCLLAVAPVVSTSFTRMARQGGDSVIHKNGPTPVWIAEIQTAAADYQAFSSHNGG